MRTRPEASLRDKRSERVKWTYQTDRTTTDGVVFAWLLEQGNRRSGKERANEAVKAFYSAFAYRDLPGTPAALAREIAIQALWALVGRILSLADAFDLDLMPVAAALSYSRPVTHPIGVPLPTAKALEAATQSAQAAVTPVENPDDYDSDDAMFG